MTVLHSSMSQCFITVLKHKIYVCLSERVKNNKTKSTHIFLKGDIKQSLLAVQHVMFVLAWCTCILCLYSPPGEGSPENIVAAMLANDTGLVVAYCLMIPNQPIVFTVKLLVICSGLNTIKLKHVYPACSLIGALRLHSTADMAIS